MAIFPYDYAPDPARRLDLESRIGPDGGIHDTFVNSVPNQLWISWEPGAVVLALSGHYTAADLRECAEFLERHAKK